MTIYEKLLNVQNEIKAPKNLHNDFAHFDYRNCEGILESAKPLLKKNKLTLSLSDDITQIGDRIYVKAIATLTDLENDGVTITNTAFAREPLEKKGMDGSQITGATSSYARKYALNGLFLLDDEKDADTDEYHEINKDSKQSSYSSPDKPWDKYRKKEYNEDTCVEYLENATTLSELQERWGKIGKWKGNEKVITAKETMKEKLNG